MVLGKKEIEAGLIAIRLRSGRTTTMGPDDCLKRIKIECEKRVDGIVDGTVSADQYDDSGMWTFKP